MPEEQKPIAEEPNRCKPQEVQLCNVAEDARALLRYAVESGKDLENEVDSVRRILTTPTAETAAELYVAYGKIAKIVEPVTAQTLRVEEVKIKEQIRWDGMFGFVVACVIVALSVITYMTDTMSDSIQELVADGNKLALKLDTELNPQGVSGDNSKNQADSSTPAAAPVDYIPGNSSDSSKPPPAPVDYCSQPAASQPAASQASTLSITSRQEVVGDLRDFAVKIRDALATAGKLDFFVANRETSPLDFEDNNKNLMIHTWATNSRILTQINYPIVDLRAEVNCKINTYQDVRQFAQNVRLDSILFWGAVVKYLLPVFYAYLGALAYDLRMLSEGLRQHTYRPTPAESRARKVIALTMGAIISLFASYYAGLSLSPLLFAFLLGYGVEAFSSFLDRLVSVFKIDPRAGSAGKP